VRKEIVEEVRKLREVVDRRRFDEKVIGHASTRLAERVFYDRPIRLWEPEKA
jgi:hypothetical protein